MHNLKELEIWKRSRVFCSLVYSVTNDFSASEKFGIINQIRRCAVSVPSNIAEGASRESNKDFCRFLEIAIGSCYELETQLLISNDLGFLDNSKLKDLQDELNRIIMMTSRFRSVLKKIIKHKYLLVSDNQKIQ